MGEGRGEEGGGVVSGADLSYGKYMHGFSYQMRPIQLVSVEFGALVLVLRGVAHASSFFSCYVHTREGPRGRPVSSASQPVRPPCLCLF